MLERLGVLASLPLAGTGQRERGVFRIAINRFNSHPDGRDGRSAKREVRGLVKFVPAVAYLPG